MGFNIVRKRLAAGFVSIIIAMGMNVPAQAADAVTAAEDWFANLTTMQADFTQISTDGSASEGTLYLRRPHRRRRTRRLICSETCSETLRRRRRLRRRCPRRTRWRIFSGTLT